eukprot:TRINITY_DN11279_c0_g1_i1.p1 TRINITY_DN11279_c0_g1~~TRINITY_DN11279_c0_g1_i1.p1  ORF type:complete len:347 (-),score=49.45 TRINITY_DN11279_c0_g1_i1:80-1120(-)
MEPQEPPNNAEVNALNSLPPSPTLNPLLGPLHTETPVSPENSRRKRKQVKKACTNCRKAHSACDAQRPCNRCKKYNLESTCVDHQRKKRKYKLQDGKKRTGQFNEVFGRETSPPMEGVPNYWSASGYPIPDLTNYPTINVNGSEALVVSRTEFQQMQNVMKEVLLEVHHLKTSLRQEQLKSQQLETQLNHLQQSYISNPVVSQQLAALRNTTPGRTPEVARAIWRVADRALIEHNERFTQLLHYTPEQLKGLRCHDLFARAVLPYTNDFYSRLEKLETAEEILHIVTVFQTGRHEEIGVSVTCHCQFDNGTPRFYIMSIVEQDPKETLRAIPEKGSPVLNTEPNFL